MLPARDAGRRRSDPSGACPGKGQPVCGADLNRSESSWSASLALVANSSTSWSLGLGTSMTSNGFRVRPRGSTELLRFPASCGFIGDLQFGALGLCALNRFTLTTTRRRSLSASCTCFLQSLRPDRERDGKKATDNRSTERHAIRACHRTVDGHRPEPAQIVGTAAGRCDQHPTRRSRRCSQAGPCRSRHRGRSRAW
jgi:hypothetical protein